MPVTYLDIAGSYVGPGAYGYNVATWPGGAVLFVNSSTGSPGAGRGRVTFPGTSASVGAQPFSAQGPYGDPNKPLNSVWGVGGAMSYVTAGRGDMIVVGPNHVETLPQNVALPIPDNVTIQGCGYGNTRPRFTFTAISSIITPSGSCSLNNLVFDLTGVASMPVAFNISTTGVQFNICRILQATPTNQAVNAITLLAGCTDFLFNGSEIDGSAAPIPLGTAIYNPAANNIFRCIIVNSQIHGQYATAPLNFVSTGTTQVWITSNLIRQEHASTTFAIVIPTTATFLASLGYNDLYSLAGAATRAALISGAAAAGFASFQNFAASGTTPGTAAVAI